jgi:hypothetical protein
MMGGVVLGVLRTKIPSKKQNKKAKQKSKTNKKEISVQ